eukprot:3269903-Prymnesium_polylepis.1
MQLHQPPVRAMRRDRLGDDRPVHNGHLAAVAVDQHVRIRRENRRTEALRRSAVAVNPNRTRTLEDHQRLAVVLSRCRCSPAAGIVERRLPRRGRRRAVVRAALVDHAHPEVWASFSVSGVAQHRAVSNLGELAPIKVVALPKRNPVAQVLKVASSLIDVHVRLAIHCDGADRSCWCVTLRSHLRN